MRAIQISEFGGPEVLQLVDVPDPEPAAGFEVVNVTAAGVNYADTHATDNSYLQAQTLPQIPGSEVVGTTSDGRRIAALIGSGGYAERQQGDQRQIDRSGEDRVHRSYRL